VAGGSALSRRQVLFGGVLLLASSRPRVISATPGDPPVIDPEVRAAVARGPTRVLVALALPPPSASDTNPRTTAIASVRQIALARLAGTGYRLVRQYETVPLIALEIGPDALRALEAMGDLVSRVRLDQALPPPMPR